MRMVMFTALLPLLIMALIPAWPAGAADDRADLWAKVAKADADGLPQTAIEHLNAIAESATAAGAHGDAMRAVVKRIFLESVIQGNRPEEKIHRLKAALATAPEAARPLLTTVLATWYWHYYDANRWRFMERTRTGDSAGDDFTAWDLPRLFAEVGRLHAQALEGADALKKVDLRAYADFLVPGDLPLERRPTLYDFMAREALHFHAAAEQAFTRPEEAFDIDAAGPALAPAAEFVAWKPETDDGESPKLAAVRLHQALLAFHAADADPAARLDADLARLIYIRNVAFGPEKLERYMERMKELETAHPDHPVAAEAAYERARTLHELSRLVEARELAAAWAARFPAAPGGIRCAELVDRIEARELSAECEHAGPPEGGDLLFSYRNITRAFVRVVRDDWRDFRGEDWRSPGYHDRDKVARLLAAAPAAAFAVDLPPTADFRPARFRAAIPALPEGFYRILVSGDEKFSESGNQLQVLNRFATTIAVVFLPRDGKAEGLVVESVTGQPAQGARATVWVRGDRGRYRESGTVDTDRDGRFALAIGRGGGDCFVEVTRGRAECVTPDSWTYERPERETANERVVFVTDRAIYRPGQTIRFKGIALRIDAARDRYEVLPGRKVRVTLRDPNHQEVGKLTLATNDFGSFAGEFTTPPGRATGAWSLGSENPEGGASVRVEEYKRPKFRVEIDRPKAAARLDETVALEGRAVAYSGAPMDGATVKWRVERKVRMPWWCFWWRPLPAGSDQQIARGTAKTDAEGRFRVTFRALPDRSVDESANPSFEFAVHADATDSTGETRSARTTVTVGFAALEARIQAAEFLAADRPVELKLDAATLDGAPLPFTGTLTVFRLAGPASPVPPDLLRDDPPTADEIRDGIQGADWRLWPTGERAAHETVASDGAAPVVKSLRLTPGAYRAVLETADPAGRPVRAERPLLVLDPAAGTFPVPVANHVAASSVTVEVGQTAELLWGSGHADAAAWVEVAHRGRVTKSHWIRGRSQAVVRVPVEAELRGGFTVRILQVRDGRLHARETAFEVPWSDRMLQVSFETFRSPLLPGAAETWSLRVRGPGAETRAAELACALYDASLDAFAPHAWGDLLPFFRRDGSAAHILFTNRAESPWTVYSHWGVPSRVAPSTYWRFPAEVSENLFGYMYLSESKALGGADFMMDAEGMAPPSPASAPAPSRMRAEKRKANGPEDELAAPEPSEGGEGAGAAPAEVKPDLDQVSARTNLSETAFFFPQVTVEPDGAARITFTMPEALTTWKFLGLAHGRAMESGLVTAECRTQKPLMVEPAPPRFLREGDRLVFPVKVSNLSEAPLAGAARLSFRDAVSEAPRDAELKLSDAERKFSLEPGRSVTLEWEISVPDGLPPVLFKAVAAAGEFSDGEEQPLPVLSRRLFVTESLPLPVRGPADKNFRFEKLIAATSETLVHHALTVEMTSNPAWYAVQALPYLMEFPHECAEQIFHRLYANALAARIAGADPKIRRVFDQWKGTDALASNLERNENLKAALLSETPWVLQAKDEAAAKRRIGLLLDANHMRDVLARAQAKLAAMQLPDGAWPWFPGGRGDTYITLLITTGYGRLGKLGAKIDEGPALRALGHLDKWLAETHREILRRGHPEENHLTPVIALYLYGRGFYLDRRPVPPGSKDAVGYFFDQARKFWLKLDSRQAQGHLALGLARFGDRDTPAKILASLKERSVTDEELGRFWRDQELSWWWWRAPIAAQAMMIECFDEIANDRETVEELKVWLLKQKQTQDWKTTTATADAIYALLLRGADLLASDKLVAVELAGTRIDPGRVEAGTGRYEKRFAGTEVKPEMGVVRVVKEDAGVAWGALHWQYFEDMTKIAPHATNLSLRKALFVKRDTAKGPTLDPVSGPLAVGDRLVVRIELRSDRDMEYVHLKDGRGAGLEPADVLSAWNYRDGLAYYNSTRDTASHYFISYLPKGTYVFEYELFVAHRGEYQTGMAEIQCMYAPEFGAHSESIPLSVK